MFNYLYQDGQIQITDLPQNLTESTRVLENFLEPGKVDAGKLRQIIEQLETIAGIEQGLEEVNTGQTRPVSDFIDEMQQKYDISG
ncbi:MAG: hypothetical protein AAFQ91_14700 [Cyanobacteria bacterium J06621_15]